jgi:hypothetical protein
VVSDPQPLQKNALYIDDAALVKRNTHVPMAVRTRSHNRAVSLRYLVAAFFVASRVRASDNGRAVNDTGTRKPSRNTL